jgi:hypothetical protein
MMARTAATSACPPHGDRFTPAAECRVSTRVPPADGHGGTHAGAGLRPRGAAPTPGRDRAARSDR